MMDECDDFIDMQRVNVDLMQGVDVGYLMIISKLLLLLVLLYIPIQMNINIQKSVIIRSRTPDLPHAT
jgi:hypothetical protein